MLEVRDRRSQAVHSRLYRRFGYAREHLCVWCLGSAREWAYLHDDPKEIREADQIWSEGLEHYAPMCASCHRRWDHLNGQRKAPPDFGGLPGGLAFAARLKTDPDFATEMSKIQHHAARLGGLAKFDRSAQREALFHTNSRQVRCLTCGKTSTPSGVANHQRYNAGHEGREDV